MMSQDVCLWSAISDLTIYLDHSDDDCEHEPLFRPYEVSCRDKKVWMPEIDNPPEQITRGEIFNIVDDALHFCPYCGKKIKTEIVIYL